MSFHCHNGTAFDPTLLPMGEIFSLRCGSDKHADPLHHSLFPMLIVRDSRSWILQYSPTSGGDEGNKPSASSEVFSIYSPATRNARGGQRFGTIAGSRFFSPPQTHASDWDFRIHEGKESLGKSQIVRTLISMGVKKKAELLALTEEPPGVVELPIASVKTGLIECFNQQGQSVSCQHNGSNGGEP